MAKELPSQDFEPIETSQLDSATDAIGTDNGLIQDAMQDDRPTVTGPVSFAEAARLLGANESTLRKRWWPRVLEACQGTTIEPIAIVGHTKAGNPIGRVSIAGFKLLQTFALIAGDVEAIARWIERTRIENAIDDADEALGDVEPIAPEIEPIAPWEPGPLAIVPSQSAAIAVDADWVRGIDEGLEADWTAIAQHQTDLTQTLATGGNALSQAMRRVALAQLTEANAVYQQTMAQGVKAIVAGNLAAVTGQGHPPGDRSSAA
jgi:hypothetical protein